MTWELILFLLSIIVLIIASYCDLKSREVPDWLNYGFLFAAFGIRIIYSFHESWSLLFSGVFGFFLALGISSLFYYTNQWGGGDSKLFWGMGAVIGVTLPFDYSSWNLLWFFLALLFIGAIYGLIWMGFQAVKRKNLFLPEFQKRIRSYKNIHLTCALFTLFFLGLSLWQIYFWPLLLLPLGLFYLFLFVQVVEDCCFLKKMKVSQLTEGDWLAEDIVVNGKTILYKKTLEKADFQKLKPFVGEDKKVLIKEGIPFVPNFFLAYLLLIFGQKIFAYIFTFF